MEIAASVLINRCRDMSLNINSNNIFSCNWVKIFGIKVDSRQNLEHHISDLCKYAARQ